MYEIIELRRSCEKTFPHVVTSIIVTNLYQEAYKALFAMSLFFFFENVILFQYDLI